MENRLRDFAFMSGGETERPYLPYQVAVETGTLTDVGDKARHIDAPPGVVLASGFIPNGAGHGAGIVDVGNEIVVFDHASIKLESDQVRITPTSKSKVSDKGEIIEEGVIVLQNQKGLLRFAAFAINIYKHPRLVDQLSRGNLNRRRMAGKIAVFNAPALEVPDYEITDVNLKTASVLAKPRIRYS